MTPPPHDRHDSIISKGLEDLRESLTENTTILARVDEQLKMFKEKLLSLDQDMRDVKKHVDSVRAISRIFLIGLSASTAIGTILRLTLLK